MLFLTTNRVGGFDEAIISRYLPSEVFIAITKCFACRIHFSLHLKKFDSASRLKVWKNNFDRLKRERKDIGVNYQVLQYVETELAEQDWNGREIRNGMYTFPL